MLFPFKDGKMDYKQSASIIYCVDNKKMVFPFKNDKINQ